MEVGGLKLLSNNYAFILVREIVVVYMPQPQGNFVLLYTKRLWKVFYIHLGAISIMACFCSSLLLNTDDA